jgi:VanZ family protein
MALKSATTCGTDSSRVVARSPRMLGCVCGLVLCGILVAGLWPFHSPRNDVAWLPEGNGLTVGPHGSIVSAGEFESRNSSFDASCSIELWLRPAVALSSGTILAFYQPSDFSVPFALRQSLGDLRVEVGRQDGGQSHIYLPRVFLSESPSFLTITSGTQGTIAYVDGRELKRFPTYHVRKDDLRGKLLVGNTPSGTHEWSGRLLALTVYNQELSPSEVFEHYENWTTHKVSKDNGHAVAVYAFNEGTGSVAHNQVDPGTDLLIPKRFFVVHEKFLTWPWNEYYPGRNYWKNVVINIGGFIPLGFFFCAYLSTVRMTPRPALATVIVGFAVSLTIEVLQAFLPTRDSGLTDVITNTAGTALGMMLYQYFAILALTMFARLPGNVESQPHTR